MVNDCAKQHAVEAFGIERQILDVSDLKRNFRVFRARALNLRQAEIDSGDLVARAMEERAENARAAAEVRHARSAWKAGQPHEGIDQPLVRCRRKRIIVLESCVLVEKGDLFQFILSAYRPAHMRYMK